ncbi:MULTISPECIES: hypothetical protein [unclassified Streptococcus]|uniref:hypothetical protein n=1 Tax=unclassified Streptococcus TaxID=2608887 RepID=UPI00107266D7|nr:MULTISPECIES: hypothetical protein [unclassified Streptococcus]MBF0786839.1 hypothetical protein [Streptococcus sp. 19428wC2_LYSM12]MCQ9212752.1 hypothetical protein [Streptococcus sp. B01]MCQ9214093.1 hypothetical protein [Streptococcus sp. O1]TFV06211.1 hypothetical protein E4T79_02765 [Streptococcus sp. LYSM12]
MEYEDVEHRLFEIINRYIGDAKIREQLLEQARVAQSVRGVLYSLDEHKIQDFTEADLNFCKDLFFYFG